MNTRFNPTANGPLHLGHLYLILINSQMSRQSGGKFVVRFDDDQYHWIDLLGRPAIAEICQQMRNDLEWMGIAVDTYSYESREREANEIMIQDLPGIRPLLETGYGPAPEVISCSRPYPYVPYLTAVKVAQDYREGIDCVIRGDDLISEFSLYSYFCERLGLTAPRFLYVPKLLHQGSDLADVSKTRGNFKLRDLRAKGLTPNEIESFLARACLKNPEQGWAFANVKTFPTLRTEEAGNGSDDARLWSEL